MLNIRKAFTLVEILIVVVILGILAAIVVPQFTAPVTQNSSERASLSLEQRRNIERDLEEMRKQLSEVEAQSPESIKSTLIEDLKSRISNLEGKLELKAKSSDDNGG
jgi:prepilin-type N-terminal cleavage/methylation domain-containing protein